VRRGKDSLDTEQPSEGDELRAIKRYLATRDDRLPWLFVSERGHPMTRQAVNYLIAQAGVRAGLGTVWPHMLRHSAGYALSNRGHDFRLLQDFMGHRDPRHTARYTRTASVAVDGAYATILQQLRGDCHLRSRRTHTFRLALCLNLALRRFAARVKDSCCPVENAIRSSMKRSRSLS
jgi:hypothetical protein